MKTFFIADTHFGDAGILRYEKRPFSSVEEMDEAMIRAWNSVVSQEDLVFHLGDVSMYGQEKTKEILTRLKGEKVLILGNHDLQFSEQMWREMGINKVSTYPILYNGFFLLSHEPLYVNEEMPYANLFGHVHKSPLYRDYSSHHFCVSCERIDYKPIELEAIKEKIAAS